MACNCAELQRRIDAALTWCPIEPPEVTSGFAYQTCVKRVRLALLPDLDRGPTPPADDGSEADVCQYIQYIEPENESPPFREGQWVRIVGSHPEHVKTVDRITELCNLHINPAARVGPYCYPLHHLEPWTPRKGEVVVKPDGQTYRVRSYVGGMVYPYGACGDFCLPLDSLRPAGGGE